MQFSWNDPTAIMFAIYLLAMLAIGWLGYLGTKNLSDYILGGRSLGSFVTALSAGASDMSGWLLMGLPGAIYVSGLSESWIAIGLVAGRLPELALGGGAPAPVHRARRQRADAAGLFGQPLRGQEQRCCASSPRW